LANDFAYRYDHLLRKVESLERAPLAAVAAAPEDVARFERKIESLRLEMVEVLRRLQASVDRRRSAAQLQNRIDSLSHKALLLVSKVASPVRPVPQTGTGGRRPVPAGAGYSLEPGWIKTQYILQESRKKRDQWQEIQERFRHHMENTKAETLETMHARENDLDSLVKRRSQLDDEKQSLSAAWDALRNAQADLERQKQGPSPWISVGDLNRANDILRRTLENNRQSMETDRQRNERRMERLNRRLSLWRAAWEKHLSEEGRRWDVSLKELRAKSDGVAAEAQRQKAQWEAQTLAFYADQQALAQEKERFQREAVQPWLEEQASAAKQLAALETEKSNLDGVIHALQEQMATEAAQFEADRVQRQQEVRAKQTHWKEEFHKLRTGNAEKTAAEEQAIAQARQALDAEAKTHQEQEAARRARFEQELAAYKTEKSETEQRIAAERAQKAQALSAADSRLSQLQALKNSLQEAYDKELADHASARAAQRAWAEQRLEKIEDLLSQAQKETFTRLISARQEREALETALKEQRRRFHDETQALEKDYAARKSGLEIGSRQAEDDHLAYLARAKSEEERMKSEVARLESTSAGLEKKLADLRGRREEVLEKQKSRHEKILLRLTQKLDQEKVTGEERLAREKMELESLKQRVANRRLRVRGLQERRAQSLESLFKEWQDAFTALRKGHDQEAAVWAEKVASVRREKEALRDKIEHLKTGAPALTEEEIRRRTEEENQRFAAENHRLLAERKAYWASLLDQSAENAQSLRAALAVFRDAGQGLERQEAAAQEFLNIVGHHLAKVQSLRGQFQAFADARAN